MKENKSKKDSRSSKIVKLELLGFFSNVISEANNIDEPRM